MKLGVLFSGKLSLEKKVVIKATFLLRKKTSLTKEELMLQKVNQNQGKIK